jgi:hypothetical protein
MRLSPEIPPPKFKIPRLCPPDIDFVGVSRNSSPRVEEQHAQRGLEHHTERGSTVHDDSLLLHECSRTRDTVQARGRNRFPASLRMAESLRRGVTETTFFPERGATRERHNFFPGCKLRQNGEQQRVHPGDKPTSCRAFAGAAESSAFSRRVRVEQ